MSATGPLPSSTKPPTATEIEPSRQLADLQTGGTTASLQPLASNQRLGLGFTKGGRWGKGLAGWVMVGGKNLWVTGGMIGIDLDLRPDTTTLYDDGQHRMPTCAW